MSKVKLINVELLIFNDGSVLSSYHESECCEAHWLDFSDLQLSDFEGLDFDLSNNKFVEKVENYGVRLHPINGHPISVPGYGYNNGYYSSDLALRIFYDGETRDIDITDCQVIKEDN